MLDISDLVCRYGKVDAIKGISLSVEQGQLVALIGANGAGKSTTLRAISGLLTVASGKMTFEGEDITRCSARDILARGIAHCPEGRRVFPYMTVEENLEMGAYLRRDSSIEEDRDRIFAQFPRLAGQYVEYTIAQLKAFRSGERGNDPNRMMRSVAATLSDQEIAALADYIAGLR